MGYLGKKLLFSSRENAVYFKSPALWDSPVVALSSFTSCSGCYD
jgi:hypothetical protein